MARVEKSVFLSYRRKDQYSALSVYQYLTQRNYNVFLDYTSIPSGDFEQIIVSNIKARAHFIVILTPTALDRCNEPGDWLRREIETAIDEKRNIVRKVFDREVWIQEPALRQIQDTIFIQAILASVLMGGVITAIFVAVPGGHFF